MNKSLLHKFLLIAANVIASKAIAQKHFISNGNSNAPNPLYVWTIIIVSIIVLLIFSYLLTKKIDKRNNT